jgi:transcriptional regulator of heat shock response
MDNFKTFAVLKIKFEEYSNFLNDQLNGEKIEEIGEEMQKECDLTKYLISKLFK